MSDKHLRNYPHKPKSNGTLQKDVWWYEEPGGVAIYMAPAPGRDGQRIALLYWRDLRYALKRKDSV